MITGLVFDPLRPNDWPWWEPLLDENGDALLDELGDPLLVPADQPPDGSSGGKSLAARNMGHKVSLPQVQRRGAPQAYGRLSQQIEQNNKTALTLSKLIAEALTAMR